MSPRPSSCSMEKESTLETRSQDRTCRALESYRWNENIDEKLTRTWCIDGLIFIFILFLWRREFFFLQETNSYRGVFVM